MHRKETLLNERSACVHFNFQIVIEYIHSSPEGTVLLRGMLPQATLCSLCRPIELFDAKPIP